MRTSDSRTALLVLVVALGALSAGCLVVDDKYVRALEVDAGADTGPVVTADSGPGDAGEQADTGPVDAGPPRPADICGDVSAPLLTVTTAIEIDTTALGSDYALMGTPSGGNEGFFRFVATSGEFWHFHLAALSPGRNPVLYAVQAPGGICQSSTTAVRNACADNDGDEHFAFIPTTSGTYFLGIDDANPMGGRYRLQVIRPTCGDGIQEHGEPCDEGAANNANGTCTPTCRIRLSNNDGTGQTSVPVGRHNDTSAEAMVVALPGGTPLGVSGSIPETDCYPDVFAIDVNAGQTVTVVGRDPAMAATACISAAMSGYTLQLRNASDTVIASGTDDGMGCLTLRQMLPNQGRYFVWLQRSAGPARAITYSLRFTET